MTHDRKSGWEIGAVSVQLFGLLSRIGVPAMTGAVILSSFLLHGCASESSDSTQDPVSCTNCVGVLGSLIDQNGAPIQGAKVALQLGLKEYSAGTDTQGRYSLEFPTDSLPVYLSAYAYKAGFLPKGIPLVYSGGTLFTVNGSNNVQTRAATDRDVVYLKGVALTHLGDGQFNGGVNEQLQIPAQGDVWLDSFALTAQQRAAYSTLTISMSVRGLECSSVIASIYQVKQSGQTVQPSPQVLGGAPASGSFGPLTKTFSLAGMEAGEVFFFIRTDPVNAQTIATVPGGCPGRTASSGDKDDFEFIEVLGRLS
ncbi:MAG: hypothetical protein ABL983_01525 [Nitrospira sp.]